MNRFLEGMKSEILNLSVSFNLVAKWPEKEETASEKRAAGWLLDSIRSWFTELARNIAPANVSALSGWIHWEDRDAMPVLGHQISVDLKKEDGGSWGASFFVALGQLLREDVFRDVTGQWWKLVRPAWHNLDAQRAGPFWARMSKKEIRRAKRQIKLAKAGRPETLRGLYDTERIFLARGMGGPDAILQEEWHSEYQECLVRWIGSNGWKAIQSALWGRELPGQLAWKAVVQDDKPPKFSSKALFERWGVWAVSRAYTADAGPTTKVLQIKEDGGVEIIGHWAGVPWPVLRRIYILAEDIRRTAPEEWSREDVLSAAINCAMAESAMRREQQEE